MAQNRKLKLLSQKPRFYKKGEHEKYLGLYIIQEWIYEDDKGNLQKSVVMLSSKDLFHKGKDKLDYILNENKK